MFFFGNVINVKNYLICKIFEFLIWCDSNIFVFHFL